VQNGSFGDYRPGERPSHQVSKHVGLLWPSLEKRARELVLYFEPGGGNTYRVYHGNGLTEHVEGTGARVSVSQKVAPNAYETLG
jgi:hypothetical protein